jgi:hypothetical protein
MAVNVKPLPSLEDPWSSIMSPNKKFLEGSSILSHLFFMIINLKGFLGIHIDFLDFSRVF